MNDLQKDVIFLLEGQPHKVLEVQHKKMARQGATIQTKLKNLVTGGTISRNFSSGDKFEDADVEKKVLNFEYANRGEYIFVNPQNKAERYKLGEEDVSEQKIFLKQNSEVTAEFFEGKIISIILPIKLELKVVEAAPAVRGNTQGAVTKTVKLETGAMIQAPIFIGEGDTIRINTQKGEYVERVEKAR